MFHVREHIRARIGGKRHKVPKSSLSLFLSLSLSVHRRDAGERLSVSLPLARTGTLTPSLSAYLYIPRVWETNKIAHKMSSLHREFSAWNIRVRARVYAALRGLSLSLCGARNEGLSPHKADLYKALLKCTVNTEIIHPRRAIRDASARTRSLVLARMIFGG